MKIRKIELEFLRIYLTKKKQASHEKKITYSFFKITFEDELKLVKFLFFQIFL